MFLRGWNRIQQSRRDSLPTLRRGFRDETKRIANLVNGILELEDKLVSKLERNFQDVYQQDTRKLYVMQA